MHNSKQVRRAASPALQSRQIHAPMSRDHSNNKLQQQNNQQELSSSHIIAHRPSFSSFAGASFTIGRP